ncbi:MAG: hypothetical protein HQK51_19250 [Oligoflexia bacterium]|nr:hypothetical protein [Oligoflexia bacterium]
MINGKDMITTEDKFYLISSDEINNLYTLLGDNNESDLSAIEYLDFILSIKTLTTESQYGRLIYFD